MKKEKKEQPVVETFFDRLKNEAAGLSEKTVKLSSFVRTDTFNSLDSTNRALLKKQLQLMSEYLDILNQRISLVVLAEKSKPKLVEQPENTVGPPEEENQ